MIPCFLLCQGRRQGACGQGLQSNSLLLQFQELCHYGRLLITNQFIFATFAVGKRKGKHHFGLSDSIGKYTADLSPLKIFFCGSRYALPIKEREYILPYPKAYTYLSGSRFGAVVKEPDFSLEYRSGFPIELGNTYTKKNGAEGLLNGVLRRANKKRKKPRNPCNY